MKQLSLLITAAVFLAYTNTGTSEPSFRKICITSNSSNVTLSLHCPAGHVIHVRNWLTSLRHKGDISECNVNADCSHLRENDKTLLTTNCNGLQACDESISVISSHFCPNGTAPRYFQIQHECIPDNSTLSLCSDVMVTEDSTVYLKTPAFPRGSDVTNTTCTCQVQGQGLSVTVLDLYFAYDRFPDNQASLVISNSTAELWKPAGNTVMVNRDVIEPGTQHSLNISFHDHGAKEQRVWLQISAISGPLSLACGNNSHTSTSNLPSTTRDVTPTATARTSGNNTATAEMSSTHVISSSTERSSTFSGASSSESSLPSADSSTASEGQLTTSTPDPATGSSSTASVNSTETTTVLSPAAGLSGKADKIIATAVPAAVGGILAITIVIVVVVICRRRRSRKRSDDLERVPGPKGDLYTMSKKKTRDPPPSAVAIFQDHNHHSDGEQPPKASLQECSPAPVQVHHNPAFSTDSRAENMYVSNVSLASHVYQEIGELDLDPAGVRVHSFTPQKNRSHKPVMFMSVKPPAPVSHAQEENSSTKPKNEYWEVLADGDISKYEADNHKQRAASQKYKEAQPYAVSDFLTRRKTTGAKVEVVPLKRQMSAESDTEQANAVGRSGTEMDEIAQAKNAKNPTKSLNESIMDNSAVKPDSEMKAGDVFASDSAHEAKPERKRYDPYADYEAVDMNDINLECADASPVDSDNAIPSVLSGSDFDPYAGYQPVDFDDEEGHVMARSISQSPEASRNINQYEDIDCEDQKPKLQNAKNTDDCLVYNTLYESSKGLGISSLTRSDTAGTDSCSETTENTEVADEESEATSCTSVVDDHGKATPGQGLGGKEEDCLVDNILYESSQNILGSNR